MSNREIIIVTTYLSDNGADRVLTELANEWSKEREIILWCMNKNMFQITYPISERIKVVDARIVESDYLFRTKAALNLLKLLKNHSDAIVVSFLPRTKLIVSMCKPFIKNKIIFSERNDPSNAPPKKTYRFVRNIIYNLADNIVFQTEDAKRYFRPYIQKKSTIIPNPINPNLPSRYKGEKRKVIVAACRLTIQKNLPMMINAFSKFSKEHPEYTLEIYGRGKEEESLQILINKLDLRRKVFLSGFSDNIFDIMNQSSMYVSSSNYEGISNAMLEAMALGLPVVVTDCPAGGARMVVQNGKNGLLIPVGDVESMYHAMKRIVENPGLARKIADEAYKVRERFAIKRIAKEWLDVIE